MCYIGREDNFRPRTRLREGTLSYRVCVSGQRCSIPTFPVSDIARPYRLLSRSALDWATSLAKCQKYHSSRLLAFLFGPDFLNALVSWTHSVKIEM